MPDEITGLAVLQPTWLKDVWRLHYTATKASGTRFQSWIFIRDDAHNHLPNEMPDWHQGSCVIWKFRRNGNRLECHPSVNDLGNGFHNGYNWSVEYVEMVLPCTPTGEDWDGNATRHGRGTTVHYDLNLEGGREWLPEMREKGVIK